MGYKRVEFRTKGGKRVVFKARAKGKVRARGTQPKSKRKKRKVVPQANALFARW